MPSSTKSTTVDTDRRNGKPGRRETDEYPKTRVELIAWFAGKFGLVGVVLVVLLYIVYDNHQASKEALHSITGREASREQKLQSLVDGQGKIIEVHRKTGDDIVRAIERLNTRVVRSD